MAFTYFNPEIEFIPFKLDQITAANTLSYEVGHGDALKPKVLLTAAYDEFNMSTTGWPFHKRTDGRISGTVIDETAATMANVIITCLWNRNMKIVSKTISDAGGNWTVYGLDPTDTYGYTIIAQDPLTGTVYNSLSYDKIIPVEPV